MTFFRTLLLITNIFFALCLVAATAGMYVNPAGFWQLAFFGLFFPVWLFIVVPFLLFWMMAHRKFALVSLVAILVSLPALQSYVSFGFSNSESTGDTTLKVMTYNVRNFDLYNWSGEDAGKKEMMNLIKDQQPDVICFQEFYSAESGKFATISELKNELGYPYYRFEITAGTREQGSWGVATFSRLPIEKSSGIRFSNSKFNVALYTDIKVAGTVIRIFNAHLQSVYFSSRDYQYIEQVAEEQEVEVARTKRILSKLKYGFQARALQTLKLKMQTDESPHPVILCGDFNDTPVSFTYHTLTEDLNDSFLQAGFGISPTYTGFLSPFRIDFILSGKKFRVLRYRTIREKYSDHFPVICTLALN